MTKENGVNLDLLSYERWIVIVQELPDLSMSQEKYETFVGYITLRDHQSTESSVG